MSTGDGSSIAEALGNAQRRLAHANRQGQALAESIQRWGIPENLRLDCRIADDRMSWELCWRVINPPTEDWGQTFAGGVHGLRSALDNLVYAVAESVTSDERALGRVQFPIVGKRDDWNGARKRIDMLPASVRDAIEAVQPFNRPADEQASDGLLVLSLLDNADKHRVMLRDRLSPKRSGHEFAVKFFEVPPEGPPDTEVFAEPPNDGAVVLRHRTHPYRIESVTGRFSHECHVVVRSAEGIEYPVTETLATLIQYVGEVIDLVIVAWASE